MKSLLASLAILMCVSAQAATTAQQIESAINSTAGQPCVDRISYAVYMATAVSSDQQKNILSNIASVRSILNSIEMNADHKRSNKANFVLVNKLLNIHANDGYGVGSLVTECVRPSVVYSSNYAVQKQQVKEIRKALNQIEKAAL